jgi:glycosyltransferase involved in cell wall biosynthesis
MHILISAVSAARSPSGVCRYAANLALSLASTNDISRITLLVGSWQERYFNTAFRLQGQKVKIVPVDIARGPIARNIWYSGNLAQVAGKYRPDLVHLSFPVPFRQERFDCPVVSSLHDLYPYDIPENFGYPRVLLNRAFLKRCLSQSDFVVCGSDFTLGRLKSFMPLVAETKAARIYPCVAIDPAHFQRPVLPELDGRQFLLAVAQHRKNKNLGLLLTAFAKFRAQASGENHLRLVIVGGDGPETPYLRRLTRQLSLEKHLVFGRALADPALCWLYRNCALVVAPSTIEGFGLPVVEALQCGSRVLCSDIPAFREVGGEACHYFRLEVESPAIALANSMQMAMQAQPKCSPNLDRFSGRVVAAQLVALYSSLMPTGIAVNQPSTPSRRHEALDYDGAAI